MLQPEVYEMQMRAIVRAARAVAEKTGEAPLLEVMVPLVTYEQELEQMRERLERVADEEEEEEGGELELLIGTMIELPRACFVADRIAKHADFFSFGTNDLTQTALGFSRDDVGGMLSRYLELKIVDRNPFETIDSPGVGWLVRLAAWVGREARPDLKLGICGEHGGDPESIALLPARRARLRELLALPGADRPGGRRPGGHHGEAVGTAARIGLAMAQLARISFRERMERLEEESLSPLASRSYPAQRLEPEPDSDHRTPFQRDRDRIVHAKAFRRLKHKTQVFIAPEGDHYRTRLTHTLEASGIARNVARALALNEDLTEAISLGHDLGHPPFGHVGEQVLDESVRRRWGRAFRHNEHSLRVVDRLERLNLTGPVRDGILRHTGPEPPATLEGRIVRLVDRIAYINHDIDDAIRAGVLAFEDLPVAEIDLLGATGSERIETLVVDLLERSEGTGDIVQGEAVGGAMLRLRDFMFARVYLSPDAQKDKPRIERMLRALFDHYAAEPPPALVEGASEDERVIDWLAGMTDRFAIRTFTDLSLPQDP